MEANPNGTSANESELLKQSVIFQIREAQAALFQAYAARAAEPGLSPGRYPILQVIADNPGIGQTSLSQEVRRDKTTLTPTLADLERRGFITRTPDPKDGRARCLSLTNSGYVLLERLARHARAHVRRIDDILGPDKEVLLGLLRKLTQGLAADIQNGD